MLIKLDWASSLCLEPACSFCPKGNITKMLVDHFWTGSSHPITLACGHFVLAKILMLQTKIAHGPYCMGLAPRVIAGKYTSIQTLHPLNSLHFHFIFSLPIFFHWLLSIFIARKNNLKKLEYFRKYF